MANSCKCFTLENRVYVVTCHNFDEWNKQEYNKLLLHTTDCLSMYCIMHSHFETGSLQIRLHVIEKLQRHATLPLNTGTPLTAPTKEVTSRQHTSRPPSTHQDLARSQARRHRKQPANGIEAGRRNDTSKELCATKIHMEGKKDANTCTLNGQMWNFKQ